MQQQDGGHINDMRIKWWSKYETETNTHNNNKQQQLNNKNDLIFVYMHSS